MSQLTMRQRAKLPASAFMASSLPSKKRPAPSRQKIRPKPLNHG